MPGRQACQKTIMTAVKICGVRTPQAIAAAAQHGARYIGLNFYAPSPRSVDPTLGWELAKTIPTGLRSVGLFVDPDDELLERVLGQVPLDMLQLHGAETPERIAAIKAMYPLPVIKSIGVREAADLEALGRYEGSADMLLLDAKPPQGVATLPGGNALAFDWSLLAGSEIGMPWMLAGGLTPDNVAEAVRITGATAVDVASGVETRPGYKDPALIEAFMQALD